MKRSDFSKIVKKLKENFILKEDGSDHIDYDIYLGDVLITHIRTSHSPKDYQDQFIARNLHISRTDLNKFIRCTLSNDDWVKIMKQKSKWPQES